MAFTYKTITELTSEENRTCRRCQSLIPVGVLCKKNTVTGNAMYYNYCEMCNCSVGTDSYSERDARHFASQLWNLPLVKNYSITKQIQFHEKELERLKSLQPPDIATEEQIRRFEETDYHKT